MAFWDNIGWWKKIGIVAGSITAVIAALVAIANALQAGEPHWIATRSFVRDTVAETQLKYNATQQKLQSQLTQTEAQVIQSRIDAIRAKISDRELLLQKQEGPVEYRQLVQEQINGYKDALDRLSDQLKRTRSSGN